MLEPKVFATSAGVWIKDANAPEGFWRWNSTIVLEPERRGG